MKDRLTYQQVQKISAALASTEQKARAARSVIWRTERDYLFARRAQLENGSLQQHERRLASIEAAARKLLQIMRSEPLIHQVLAEKILLDGPITKEALEAADQKVADQVGHDEGELLRLLEQVQRGAANLVNDPDELRAARFDASRKDANKSMERRLIWTPIFHFCILNDIKLTFYENGGLFKALSMLHEAIGAPVLKAGSLRRAIEEYGHEPSILDEGEVYEWRPEA